MSSTASITMDLCRTTLLPISQLPFSASGIRITPFKTLRSSVCVATSMAQRARCQQVYLPERRSRLSGSLFSSKISRDLANHVQSNPWPHTIGPLIVWMAKCSGSCSSFDGSGSVWFKIDQSGLLSGTLTGGLWGQGQMVNQNSSWTTTIPKTLPSGNYLLRHELLAIHTSNAPQWYPVSQSVDFSFSNLLWTLILHALCDVR